MRKTDKKIDNQLRKSLIEICEMALDTIVGYRWISHTVNYDVFPGSLRIVCTFASQQALDNLKRSKQDLVLNKMITQKLVEVGIPLKKAEQQISYTVE